MPMNFIVNQMANQPKQERKKNIPKLERDEAIRVAKEMYLNGKPFASIVESTGYSYAWLRRRLNEAGCSLRSGEKSI